MSKIIACIDGSQAALAVCAAAAWAQQQLDAPLQLLHVLEKSDYPTESDMSGNIGLGTREHLLEELAELDNQRSRLMLEQGRFMLQEAQHQIEAAGVATEQIDRLQRHDTLVDTLQEYEGDTRLLIMGRQGEAHDSSTVAVGSHLENVTRTLHKPILVALDGFKAPQRFMLAYDGSATANKALTMVAQSPLLKGAPCHLVMAGKRVERQREQLANAEKMLQGNGFDVTTTTLEQEEVRPALIDHIKEHDIELLVMGAWGHSRIRHLLVGSMTNWMLHNSPVPLLLLR
ncbi:universal stress protein [Marinobacterium sediminicola]|uniref:Nucleotide-binding universal stress protein, UspA family n=1 Tax=Marinobacterium sediminicola TaxID=518898 RepID=A0ABY1RWK8_9GAMM|nr:universal stress protein [Marinobacterium sediminicola]ULG70288.1 universal stress protein [Marinobacterium sediminicola]SMR69848.1 Nucleotide-binding universal stress protein, UspA family [Marinobacterium sediminicola]